MKENIPAILFLIPFLSAVCMPLVGIFRRNWCWPVAVVSLAVMSLTSLFALHLAVGKAPIRYPLSGWNPPLGIEWLLDGLSGVMMVVVSGVALIAVIYAGPGVQVTFSRRQVAFYTLVLLLISGLTGIVLAADFFNLFVFLEVASLAAYALVAVAGGRAMIAAFRYLILGTIGASFFLLGIAYLYSSTGSLNMADLAGQLPGVLESRAVLSGIVFILIGLGIKMALVPLHGWMPDAYAYAPEAICPLMAALTTKVSLYALVRITFWVVGAGTIWEELPFMIFLGWIGAAATLVGAFLALSERNLRRMFAYGGISHIGLIVLGISLGNQTGFTGGIFYLINDAVMQAGLFFVAGSVFYRHGITHLADLARFSGKMPWTVTALVVTALSMIGIPPTGGFFGKWYILLGALEAQNYIAVAVIILGTLLTLAYFSRIFEKMFLNGRKTGPVPELEASWEVRFALGMVTIWLLLLGIFSDPAIRLIGDFALPTGF